MGSITRQSWREKPYTIQPSMSVEIDFIDSQPNYIVIYNKSNNQLYVSRFPGANATQYDFTVPPLSNRQWGWDSPLSNLYVFQGGPGTANINLTSYQAAFDPAAVSQSGQNVVVANDLNIASMPGVTITNATLPVVGSVAVTGTATVNVANTPTVNVGGAITVGNTSLAVKNESGGSLNVAGTVNIGNTPSVNIGNTVNANITSGSVNATIQNATLNSNITNALLTGNPSVTIYNNFPFSINALANNVAVQVFGTPINIPIVLIDSIEIVLISNIGDPSVIYKIASVTAYNNIPNSNINIGNSGVQFISSSNKTANYKIDIPIAFPLQNVLFQLQNISGSTITETINFYIIVKYASVTNKPVADSIISATGNFTTSAAQMVAGDTSKLLKEVHVDFKNTSASPVIYSIYGGVSHSIQLSTPTVPANSSVHQDLSFGNGIPFDDGLWAWSNNAVAQYIGGYAILANK